VALVRSDPFRDVDRLLQQLWGAPQGGPRPLAMPMDAYRKGDSFLLQLDLPGVESVIAERTFGTFSRQVVLGKTLDSGRIEATYETGVLTVAIPVAEQAKVRRIDVNVGDDPQRFSTAGVPRSGSSAASEGMPANDD
jgi:HSP20 family protein